MFPRSEDRIFRESNDAGAIYNNTTSVRFVLSPLTEFLRASAPNVQRPAARRTATIGCKLIHAPVHQSLPWPRESPLTISPYQNCSVH